MGDPESELLLLFSGQYFRVREDCEEEEVELASPLSSSFAWPSSSSSSTSVPALPCVALRCFAVSVLRLGL